MPAEHISSFPSQQNRYSFLEAKDLKKPAKMVDASTQTTSEISTQTDLRNLADTQIALIAPKMVGQEIQAGEAPQSVKYPLNHIDFEIIEVTGDNMDALDGDLAEIAPYLDGAGEAFVEGVKSQKGIAGKVLGPISNALYWTVTSTANYFRTAFYRTENEILRDMSDPLQEIRVSNSWFFGGDREVLYSLRQNSVLQTRFLNVPKWLYYEGITSIFSSDQSNTLKLLQVFPAVMEERIRLVRDKVVPNIELLARKAVTILNDAEYENVDFLTELESDLRNELKNQLHSTAEFVIHRMGEVKTGLKKVQQAMNRQIERDFPLGGGYQDTERHHIDTLKVYSDRFFKIGDAVAQEVTEAHQRVIDETATYLTGSIGDRKARIHVIIKELLELRADINTQYERFCNTRKAFEESLAS